MPVALANDGATFSVWVTEDGVDALPGDGSCATAGGQCTLRAAVMEANALGTADRIELGSLTYTLSIGGANEEGAATGDLDILDDLDLVGNGVYYTLNRADSMLNP